MPTFDEAGGYPLGLDVGDQVSSTYEGRHVTVLESLMTHPTHTDGFVDAKDPVVVGDMVGVAFTSAAAATDYIVIDTEGLWALSVVATDDAGASAVVQGDELYINTTTAIISKISAVATQRHFGLAQSPIDAGTTAVITVKVHFDPQSADQAVEQEIWVSKFGDDANDGSVLFPYLTITAAMAAVTATRKVIYVNVGTYTEAATVDWAAFSGVSLIGLGAQFNTIIGTAAGDEVIAVAPGVQASTFELTIENIHLDHDTTGLDGLLLDNTSMTKKLNAYLRNFGADGDAADKSITVTHGDTSNAVRIYMDGINGSIEGAIFFEAGDGGDRLYITGNTLNGGIEFSADAIALDLRLIDCVVLHEGITGGSTSLVAQAMSCFSETGGTFAALDGDDIAGNITGESILT